MLLKKDLHDNSLHDRWRCAGRRPLLLQSDRVRSRSEPARRGERIRSRQFAGSDRQHAAGGPDSIGESDGRRSRHQFRCAGFSTSALRRAEYSLDAGPWTPVAPVDGILDSPSEQFRLHIDSGPGGRTSARHPRRRQRRQYRPRKGSSALKTKTLERVLSKAGLGSRTQARSWIHAGRVRVNGRVVENPDQWIDFDRDRILFDGKPLQPQRAHLHPALQAHRVHHDLQRPRRAAHRLRSDPGCRFVRLPGGPSRSRYQRAC